MAPRRWSSVSWQLLLLLFCLANSTPKAYAQMKSRQLSQTKSPAAAPAPNLAKNSGTAVYPFMPALFVFGDSFVDTGNLAHLSKTALPYPYGNSPGKEYTITSRYSNGLVLSDYLSQLLGLSPLSHPFLQPDTSWYYGCNFAYSGSGALRTGSNPGPLPDQTIAFREFVGNATRYWRDNSSFPPSLSSLPRYPKPDALTEGLYLIVIGANDVLPIRGALNLVANVTASLRSTIETIYSFGGRNFLVSNVIDFGCIPFVTNGNKGACAYNEESVSAALGAAYQALLNTMEKRLPDATFLTLDLFNLTRSNTSNASPLGFPEQRRACCWGGGSANIDTPCGSPEATTCTDPGRRVFWDSIHFTTDLAAALAREAFAGSSYIRTKNIMQAFVMPRMMLSSST